MQHITVNTISTPKQIRVYGCCQREQPTIKLSTRFQKMPMKKVRSQRKDRRPKNQVKKTRKPKNSERDKRRSESFNRKIWKQCIQSFMRWTKRSKRSSREFSLTAMVLIRIQESSIDSGFNKRQKNGCRDQLGVKWKTPQPKTQRMLKGTTTTTYGTTLILQMFKISIKRECQRSRSAIRTRTLALPKQTLLRKLVQHGFAFTLPEGLAQRV